MPYLFFVYMAVTVGTGTALLLLWRQDRKQTFSALLGLSHLVYALAPVAYAFTRLPDAHWKLVGLTGLSLVSATYLILLVLGFGHLSGRVFNRRKLLTLGVVVGGINLALMFHHPPTGQAFYAVLNTVIGVVVATWLRKLGPGERVCGVLIVCCGLLQFTYVILGDKGAELQTALACVLRMLLGMSLMYAALTRSGVAIKQMRDRFFMLTERSPQGVVVVRQGAVAYVNPALRQIYGVDAVSQAPTVFSRAWLDATVPANLRQSVDEIVRGIRQGDLHQAEWEGERLALDGRRLHLRFRAWQVQWDGADATQLAVIDDTARVDADRALLWRATHDELTGLPNRQALLRRLQALFSQAQRPTFALVLLDVDRFKLFNEAHGQEVGDAVLHALAGQLLKRFGQQAEVMRLGEDEFALLILADDAVAQAEALAAAIKAMLRDPLTLPAHRFFLDVSMGGGSCPSACAPSAEALLQAAQAAMHEAKRLPGTSFRWASEQGTQGLLSSFSAEQALRAGLQNDEFKLVYQPKVAARGHRLIGFEALVRWDRPGVGRVNPLDFIPAAERTGLIVPLGALILTAACRQLAVWRDQGLDIVPVAVNVSPLQLLDAEFPATVMRTLREFDLPPQWLTLEITETAAVTHMDQAQGQISQLRQQGVEVALDDFGTGFSSLNMLRSLPLQTVKIDRSLIDPMPGEEAVAVVHAICDLARVLRLDVVAEGVETPAHAAAALRAGCDALQGYFFARPLEVEDATRWLREPEMVTHAAAEAPPLDA